ncbi:MAG TPA: GntR family transcriptional regulator [Geminicoccaceae bacterium]|nr:GntR family transcriptional regulator [Geminicoccaceae bacterium]
MKPLALQPRLVEQAYEAVLDEICDGALPPGTHLVQEQLAARLGVSRQPVQQALLLLKSDGLLQDAGRRGLVVAPVDLGMMRHRYQIRATLDALAARLAAEQCAAVPAVAAAVERDGKRIIAAGVAAVATGCVHDMVARDVAFHGFLYEVSGNPLLGPTAQRHWRYLRRVMGEVLRRAEPPRAIWRQHREILGAIVAGDPERGEALAVRHVEAAEARLRRALGQEGEGEAPADGGCRRDAG